MIEYIKSDLYRYYGKVNYYVLFLGLVRSRIFRFQFILRICQSKSCIKYLGLILWVFNRTKYTIQISNQTRIGYGLYIGHGGPIVINKHTIIGNNVNLSQNLTIGCNNGKGAKIGDCVYIGPNVCIVEDVEIGDNVTIGAGSVVTKNIPTNATAAGNYAKVLNYNRPGRYIQNPYSSTK